MNYSRLLKTLQSDEGWSEKPYKDTLGYWTIGYGFRTVGGRLVNSTTPIITREAALEELRNLAYRAVNDAQLFFPDLQSLDPVRQEVLAEMAYQMGFSGLSQFRGVRKKLYEGDFKGAAQNMRNSLWARQTPARAKRAADRMEKGGE